MRVGWMNLAPIAVALGLALGWSACGDEQLRPAPHGSGGDGGEGGDGGNGGAEPVHPGDPVPLPVAEWMVAFTNAPDPILAAIEDQSLVQPSDGYLGLMWQPVVPGEMHELIGSAFRDYIYAVATVDVPPGHRVLARGDTVASIHTNNLARQPGDFYHSRRMRVVLGSDDGANLIAVRALGRRSTPEIELWSTDAEIVFNTEDVTAPDFVVGDVTERWLGIATLVMEDDAPSDVTATVVESSAFAETEVVYASLQPSAVTQLSFRLEPKAAFATAGEVPVTLRISSPSLDWEYQTEVVVPIVDAGARYRVTRRSAIDGSTQYYAVMPPTDPTSSASFGLILSLHGASVEATGQAAAYSPKDWSYLIAPTNRRPYGFDWEEWGRLDAIEALDHAMGALPINPLRVHLTGHSMGGHGTWHTGVHFADRFGVIAPSAGWISFALYGGPAHPSGTIGRARAASQTLDFVDNLADRSVYIIHGTADDNVPASHAQTMFTTLTPIVPELVYHAETGARHWWDIDQVEEGADCVDWEPMIDAMETRQVDPLPLDFHWVSPGPFVNPRHSFVSMRAAATPMENLEVTSVSNGASLTVTTVNVAAMTLDGAALAAAGITSVDVDGTSHATGSDIVIGSATAKHPAQYGPMNQLYQRPFCYVWPDDPGAYRRVASWLTSWWSVIGNGQACGVPLSRAADLGDVNRVYLGIESAALPDGLPMSWDAAGVHIDGETFTDVAFGFLFPAGEGLAGYFYATAGSEYLLFRYVPFSSRAGMPDWLVWNSDGSVASGFFDADWLFDATLSQGLP